jgi:hypothetical protein
VSKAADTVGRAASRGTAGRRRRGSLLEDLPEFVETMLGRDGMDDPDSMADARPPPFKPVLLSCLTQRQQEQPAFLLVGWPQAHDTAPPCQFRLALPRIQTTAGLGGS